MNWKNYMKTLSSIPMAKHRFMPPCPQDIVQKLEIEERISLPFEIKEMLNEFNGAELFEEGIALITIFGLMANPPQSALDWPKTCCFEHWIPFWRSSGIGGVPVARSSSDELWILDGDKLMRWDNQYSEWTSSELAWREWADLILEEGRTLINELNLDSGSQPQ